MSQGTTKGIPIDTDVTLATDSDQLVASQKATKAYVDNGLAANSHTVKRTLTAVVDGAGSAITTGAKYVDVSIPCNCTITKWRIIADQSGSCVLDIWVDDFASYPPTVADTITAAAKPTLTLQRSAESSTLTGWTTSLVEGDVLVVNVDSLSTITKLTLVLFVTETV